MKACFLDVGTLLDKREILDPLKEICDEVRVFDGICNEKDEVVKRAEDCEILAFALGEVTNEMIDALPKLKIIQFIGTGMWNFVDVDYAESKGIIVKNIEAYGNNAVAEYAVACIFSLARMVPMADRVVKSGRFSPDGLGGLEIQGSNIGVIGTGAIGSLVAEKLHKLGANVSACDIYENEHLKKEYGVKYLSMDEIFETSDIVTTHMKVTPKNNKIINADLFNKMHKGSLFVNVARAELVDFDDMVAAVDDGTLKGVVIDVYNHEPPSDAELEFARRDNVIATPHIGFFSEQANDNSFILSVESILKAYEEMK